MPTSCRLRLVVSFVVLVGALCAASSALAADEPLRLSGAACDDPPILRCPAKDCPGELVIDGGPVVDPGTGRNYFLDYPCDLKPDEEVMLILSLHGGGSFGNWQRHYFPIVDYVDRYRLVVITPNAPPRFWTADDDAYLESIVSSVIDQIGKDRIKSFWLAGHSQGGMTSNRIVCSDFFAKRVDGWLSLSGGRIGPATLAASFGLPRAPAAASEASGAEGDSAAPPPPPPRRLPVFPTIDGANGPETPRPAAAVTPKCDISYIFESGELEIEGLPEASPWAEKYRCSARTRLDDIIDTSPGYVYDTSRQDPSNPAWGREARPGTAEVFVYPGCKDDRLVADVLRLDKGHTEGLEPKVTEELVKMMIAAPGGKLKSLD